MQRLCTADQSDGDARQQFAFGQPFLHPPAMRLDRTGERSLLDRNLLLIDPKRDQARHEQADQRDQNDDETQPDQATTLGTEKCGGTTFESMLRRGGMLPHDDLSRAE